MHAPRKPFRCPMPVLLAALVVWATSGAASARAADAPARGTAALEGRTAERTRDGSVRPVAFVNVIVMGAKLGTLSDESGRFRLVAIPAGTWRVKVMQAGLHPLDHRLGDLPGTLAHVRLRGGC